MLNEAVNAAVDSGLQLVVAAGNSNTPACTTSPASASKAITVGAVDDRHDNIASFSNWGKCVDIFASGVYVVSLSKNNNGTMAISGTSMSTPIVTGIIAQFLAGGDSTEIAVERLFVAGTRGAIPRKSVFVRPKTVNLMAFNNVRIEKRNSYVDESEYDDESDDSDSE